MFMPTPTPTSVATSKILDKLVVAVAIFLVLRIVKYLNAAIRAFSPLQALGMWDARVPITFVGIVCGGVYCWKKGLKDSTAYVCAHCTQTRKTHDC